MRDGPLDRDRTPGGPLFSVVTISYNQGEFLDRAIQSVVSQAGVRSQYIICDPGSKDNSRAVIDSYGDAIAVRVYERDDGPADGLNRGFAHARGDIYAYLNADDTFLPDAFSEVARHFDERPELDVLLGHALVTDRRDKVLRRAWSNPYWPRMAAYGATSHIQPSTFFRADAFRRAGGFNPDNRSSWDGELLLDMYEAGARIGVLDAFLSTYRLHGDSITNVGGERADALRFLDKRFARLMGRPRRRYDYPIGLLCRAWARLRSPRMFLEQLLRGPIYRRGED